MGKHLTFKSRSEKHHDRKRQLSTVVMCTNPSPHKTSQTIFAVLSKIGLVRVALLYLDKIMTKSAELTNAQCASGENEAFP